MDFCDLIQAFLFRQGWDFDAFICHAKADRAFVAMLHDEMLKCGLRTIGSLNLGDSVQDRLAYAIVNSPFFVVVLSNSFQNRLHPESEAEAAMAFPKIHKKIIPVLYQMSVDDCLQTNNELYYKLAAITGLHKGYQTDKQFAKSISQHVGQLAVEQFQSSKLPFHCFLVR